MSNSNSQENIKKLEEQLRQKEKTLQELETLNKLSRAISSTMDVDKIIKTILSEISNLIRADHSSIMVIKEKVPDVLTTLCREKKEIDTTSLDNSCRTIAGWVLKSKESLLVTDILVDPRFEGLKIINDRLYSVLATPMQARGQIIGIMVFQNLKGQDIFTEEHKRLLSIIAAQSAQLLLNAQLYQSIEQENIYLRKEVEEKYQFKGIIGKSRSMEKLFHLLERVIPTAARVLLEGETGTGKELIARAIHYNGSRKDKKFLAIDCGAIPENLLESELFGYKKGAFTGATSDKKGLFVEASGGTLFLDEINNMPISLQSKLLRAIQEGEVRPVGSNQSVKVDVRIISASSKDLKQCMDEGTFREDLFYRLKVVSITLPPLRDRKEDIPLLVDHFLSKYLKAIGKNIKGFEKEAMILLEKYHWQGNIRELENVIERAVTLAGEEDIWISPNLLPEEIKPEERIYDDIIPKQGSLAKAVETLEQKMIKDALMKFNGNKTKTAEELGLSRRGLINKIERYKLL
jgi:Nif-specific regulatory protein